VLCRPSAWRWCCSCAHERSIRATERTGRACARARAWRRAELPDRRATQRIVLCAKLEGPIFFGSARPIACGDIDACAAEGVKVRGVISGASTTWTSTRRAHPDADAREAQGAGRACCSSVGRRADVEAVASRQWESSLRWRRPAFEGRRPRPRMGRNHLVGTLRPAEAAGGDTVRADSPIARFTPGTQQFRARSSGREDAAGEILFRKRRRRRALTFIVAAAARAKLAVGEGRGRKARARAVDW